MASKRWQRARRDTAHGLRSAVGSFNRHHDELSISRQRAIAALSLVANGVVAVLYVTATHSWKWHFVIGPLGQSLGLTLWILSLACLFFASPAYRSILSFGRNLSSRWQPADVGEPPWLRRSRKWVFYTGTYLNFGALAVLVEESGGLVKSPFTPVLFAMILGAQQLSRFRMNSSFFIGFGVVITLLLFLLEKAYGLRVVPEPPARLSFWMLVASFLATALCTHVDRPPNYRATGSFPPPILVEIYSDDSGTWRYAFHCAKARLDPEVESSGDTDAMERAKHYVVQRLKQTMNHENTSVADIVWIDGIENREAVGYIRLRRP